MVVLGVVVRPHGLRGELCVKLFNPESGLLFKQTHIIVRTDLETRNARVVTCKPYEKGTVLMGIDSCVSRERAEALRGAEICVPRGSLPELQKGEYYYADLVGLKAILPSGEPVGNVQRVICYPSADVLLVDTRDYLIEVPMLTPYLVEIDVAQGRIVVDHIEDLERQKLKK
jgi:16S rRNA processing protein RimM